MAQTSPLKIKQIDRRVAERYLRRGLMADKDWKQHLKDLPDLEGKFDTINLDAIVAGVDDDEEDEDETEAAAS